MTDANTPAKTRLPRAMKQNPFGKDHAAERSIPDSEAAPETSLRLEDQAGVRTAEDHSTTIGEPTTVVTEREDLVAAREDISGLREEAANLREEAVRLREQKVTLCEESVRARGEVVQARSELEQLVAQTREANERLVIGTIRAQTMTEDAEQANHFKDEFLATVSHELRTPLNAVLRWARMLGSKQLPPRRARHAIATIERNASTLAHLIDDLLDVSRIASGSLHLVPQPVDLVAVTQAALDAVRPLAVTKNVQLVFSPDLPALGPVRGDAGRLEQVIWNPLANAIKFTPKGGRVGVFIEPSKDNLEVRVVDSGQGISPDFLPKVFECFRQADDTITGRHTGLGLGLAIVRQLVELHGGTVHAASEGVGRGATFTIRLPISAGEAQGGHAATLGELRLLAGAVVDQARKYRKRSRRRPTMR